MEGVQQLSRMKGSLEENRRRLDSEGSLSQAREGPECQARDLASGLRAEPEGQSVLQGVFQ